MKLSLITTNLIINFDYKILSNSFSIQYCLIEAINKKILKEIKKWI